MPASPAGQGVFTACCERVAVDDDLPGAWMVNAGHQVEQGRLAAARGSVDREQAEPRDAETHVVDDALPGPDDTRKVPGDDQVARMVGRRRVIRYR
jgi:hypothetical protein